MNKIVPSIIAFALATTLSASSVSTSDSLLSYVSEKDATASVKNVYDEIRSTWGFVPIVLKQYSLHPALLKAQWDLYKSLGSNKNFSPKMTTMMRFVIAESSDCNYCIGLNQGMLLNMFHLSMDEVNRLKDDAKSAKLDEKQKRMLLFILQSIRSPHSNNKLDITELHTLGWSDKDIFDGVKMGTDMVSGALLIDALHIQKDY